MRFGVRGDPGRRLRAGFAIREHTVSHPIPDDDRAANGVNAASDNAVPDDDRAVNTVSAAANRVSG